MTVIKKFICFECIGESYLSEETRLFGEQGTNCSYCGEADIGVFPLDHIANHVHSVFDHSYALTSNEPSAYDYMLLADDEIGYDWEREGEPPVEIIVEVARVSYEIAKDILKILNAHNQVDERRNPGAKRRSVRKRDTKVLLEMSRARQGNGRT